jgi:hypothetical protein
MKNEYKVSLLRNFGTEQLSVTATVNDVSEIEKEGKSLLTQFYSLIDEAFKKTVVRHDEENKFIAERIKQQKEELGKQLEKEGKKPYEIEKILKSLDK